MADYHRGEMDIQEQASTFHAFNQMTKWGSLALSAALTALVLWFCTSAGFMAGLIAAVVVAVAGFFFLKEKPQQH